MKYGIHTPLVEEVIDFAFGDGVLSAVGPAEESDDAWITNDLRLAVEANGGEGDHSRFRLAADVEASNWGTTALLGHNLLTGEDLTLEDVRDEVEWTWEDLTSNLVGELIGRAECWGHPDRKAISKALFRRFLYSPLERQLAERLRGLLPAVEPLPGWDHCGQQVAHNAVTDLWYCAENRAFNGPNDNFWERLFRLYRQGLWPCGWRGVYPGPGKFVAYRRARAHPPAGSG
jgi:hypothetical protein